MSSNRSINVYHDSVVVKPERGTMLQNMSPRSHGSKGYPLPQDSEENRGSVGQSAGQSSTSVVDQVRSPADDAGVTSSSTICPAPVCRQFWKAGNYNDELSSKSQQPSMQYFYHLLCLTLCLDELVFLFGGYTVLSNTRHSARIHHFLCLDSKVFLFRSFLLMVLDICFADGKNYLHVHPMFLHSNATSHKWAFGGMPK